MNYENPLIVQGDRSLLLDVHAPLAEECRNALIPFAELEKSPEHLHTYKLSPLSNFSFILGMLLLYFLLRGNSSINSKLFKIDIPDLYKLYILDIINRKSL